MLGLVGKRGLVGNRGPVSKWGLPRVTLRQARRPAA